MAALREKLLAELKRQEDPRVLGRGDIFDRYPSAKDKAAPSEPRTPAQTRRERKTRSNPQVTSS